MLSKAEHKVMLALIKTCGSKSSVLISPVDLLSVLGAKEFTQTSLEKIIEDLSSDGYFDLVYSDRRGEKVYCITILQKGQGYTRNQMLMRRNLVFRLAITVVLAVVSFLIGLILKAIF